MASKESHTPNLAGVINKDDLFKKNGHDYVAWARIANYLHNEANGWDCHMRVAPSGTHVWQAPNGTGYLVLYFTGPEGQTTADFPYAITDFKNQAIKWDSINSAVLCNSQRRGFAACAAYTFGLGYELWAKEEVDASADVVLTSAPTPAQQQQAPVKKAAAKPVQTPAKQDPEPVSDAEGSLSPELQKELLETIPALPADYVEAYCKAFAVEFKTGSKQVSKCFTHYKHYTWSQDYFTKHPVKK